MSRRRFNASDCEMLYKSISGAEEFEYCSEMQSSVEDALKSLKPRQLDYIYLCLVKGLNSQEVAFKYGVSVDTVEDRVSVGATILRYDSQLSWCLKYGAPVDCKKIEYDTKLSDLVKWDGLLALSAEGVERVWDLTSKSYKWLKERVNETVYGRLVTLLHSSGLTMIEDNSLREPVSSSEMLFYAITGGEFEGGYPDSLDENINLLICSLPLLQRHIVIGCCYSGMSVVDVSNEYKISVEEVHSNLDDAIATLSMPGAIYYLCNGHYFSAMDLTKDTDISMLELDSDDFGFVVDTLCTHRLCDVLKCSNESLISDLGEDLGKVVIDKLKSYGFRR